MRTSDSSDRPVVHGAIVLLAAILICVPVFRAGIPPGYDAEHHVMYQYHFSRQFWAGEIYPRWLTGANKGYGSPIFLIQYPLPYVVTALLRPVASFGPDAARENRELGLFCVLVVAAAGLGARWWLRRYCAPLVATVAAVVYLGLPVFLGQALYARAGIGELAALMWMPLALGICDARISSRLAIALMGTTLALMLFTHVISTVVFFPFLIGYAIVAGQARGVSAMRSGTSVVLALGLAVCLAATYVFPLVAYSHLFDMNAMPRFFPSFELGRWFAQVTASGAARGFVPPVLAVVVSVVAAAALAAWRSPNPPISRGIMIGTLALGISMAIPDFGPWLIRHSGLAVTGFDTAGDFSARALFGGLLTVALGILAYSRAAAAVARRERWLLTGACCAFLLMLPWSAPLWKSVEELASIHYPFRFGGVMTIAVAGLFASAVDHALRHRAELEARRSLVWLGVTAVAVIGAGAVSWRVPQAFITPRTVEGAVERNVDNMFRSYVPPSDVARIAARMQTSPDTFDIIATPVDQRVRGAAVDMNVVRGNCSVQAVPLQSSVIRVSGHCRDDARLRLSQLFSPLWKVTPTSAGGRADVSSSDGFLEVEVGGGPLAFDLVFGGEWPEKAGAWVTLASSGCMGTLAVVRLLRNRRAKPTHA